MAELDITTDPERTESPRPCGMDHPSPTFSQVSLMWSDAGGSIERVLGEIAAGHIHLRGCRMTLHDDGLHIEGGLSTDLAGRASPFGSGGATDVSHDGGRGATELAFDSEPWRSRSPVKPGP